MKNVLRGFVWALLALLLTGCPTTYPQPENALTAPTPVLSRVDSNLNQVQDVRLQLKGTYFDERNGKRVAGRPVDVLARNPSSFYIEVGSGFGSALGALASDGVRFGMLDIQGNVFYTGPATPKNLSMLLPLYLPGDDFVRVLRGGFPLSDLSPNWRQEVALEWNELTGRYRMTMPLRSGGRQEVELTHPGLGVAEIRIRDEQGKSVYLYQARDFKAFGDALLPQSSRFELVQQGLDVVFEVDGAWVNERPDASLFEIVPPTGLQTHHLNANGEVVRSSP